MENSLRAAARFANLDKTQLSVQELADEFKLTRPISVRQVLDGLAPEQISWTFDVKKTGDVNGSGSFTVLQNGWWILECKLWDDGDLYGDDFLFVVGFKHHSDIVHGTTSSGHIGHQSWFHIKKHGMDPWISENWEEVINKGMQWGIEVNPSPTLLTNAGALLTLGFLGAGLIWMMLLGSEGQCERNEEGGYTCYP